MCLVSLCLYNLDTDILHAKELITAIISNWASVEQVFFQRGQGRSIGILFGGRRSSRWTCSLFPRRDQRPSYDLGVQALEAEHEEKAEGRGLWFANGICLGY